MIKIFGSVFLLALIIGFAFFALHIIGRIVDIKYAVPSTKTTAHQLSVAEIEQLNGFFTKTEKFTGVDKRSNPTTLSGKEFNRIPESELNLKIPKDIIFFRSGFYNSAGYSLDSKTGIFVSQAILFRTKESADIYEQNLLEKIRNHYCVVLRKGKVVAAVNMYMANIEPTENLKELVRFSYEHGFKVIGISGYSKD